MSTEIYEYHMLPCLRQFNEINGFADIFQAALKERLEIKLLVASGTSWLSNGPAGYTKAMQLTFDWSQAHFFNLGQKHKEAKTMVNCVYCVLIRDKG